MKKKIIMLFIIMIIIIIVALFIIILMPPIKNKEYEEKLIEDIYNNTNLENISYVNKDNNYYIIKIENKVMVFDLNFEEKYSKEITRESNLPLVYRRNNLYYEEKIREKNKLIYNYYSTDEDKIIFSSQVGGF